MSAHGAPEPVDVAVFLGGDPALALVTADMTAWLAAHPSDTDDEGGTMDNPNTRDEYAVSWRRNNVALEIKDLWEAGASLGEIRDAVEAGLVAATGGDFDVSIVDR